MLTLICRVLFFTVTYRTDVVGVTTYLLGLCCTTVLCMHRICNHDLYRCEIWEGPPTWCQSACTCRLRPWEGRYDSRLHSSSRTLMGRWDCLASPIHWETCSKIQFQTMHVLCSVRPQKFAFHVILLSKCYLVICSILSEHPKLYSCPYCLRASRLFGKFCIECAGWLTCCNFQLAFASL